MRYFPKFRSINHLLVLLITGWIILFIFQERYRPYAAASSCKWPHIAKEDYTSQEEKNVNFEAAHIMLIADPQLIDNHTYPGRWGPLLTLSQHTADIYLKKNYKLLIKNLNPDHVLFLGDYLDNARLSEQSYYENELKRFHRIFKNSNFETFWTNVPGNHDIGFGDMVKLPALERFNKNFGPTNQMKLINHVEFIALDTPSLLSSDPKINAELRAFLDELSKQHKKTPRVLLTHVPLFRNPETQKCGPLRELGEFHLTSGYQYLSVLPEDISKEILTKLDPDLIFSGDDHDYCEILHDPIQESPEGEEYTHRAREITVKLILMAMGIKYPAVQLLTIGYDHREALSYDSTRNHYLTGICYTATPYVDIVSYVFMSVFLGIMILWWNLSHKLIRYNYLQNGGNVASSTGFITSSNSFRLLNFIKGLEESDSSASNSAVPLPLYDHRPKEQRNKIKQVLESTYDKLQRRGLIGFLGHSMMMACIVIAIYYFLFALTV